MHHWPDLERGVANLLDSISSGGLLYLGDLKRVWWLYYLPVNNNDVQQIRAAYRSIEVRKVLQKLGPVNYKIRTLFPYFMQSVIVSN